MRRLDVGDPVANRLARRLLQRPGAELDRHHRRPHQVHPLDVGSLPPHVFRAHEDDAFEPEPRAGSRGRDAVLPGARLGDDPRLAEPPGEHHLAERVVDLVRTRVIEVLSLEVQPLARGEARSQRDRRRTPRVGAAEVLHLGEIGGVGERIGPCGRQLVERRDQRLGHVASPVGAVGLGRRHERAASTYRLTLSWSLIPGADSSDDAASTAHGRTAAIAARTLSGPSLPASTIRPSAAAAVCQWPGSVPSHGKVEHPRHLLAAAQECRLAAAHLAFLHGVHLVEVRIGPARLTDPDGHREHPVREPGSTAAAARGLSCTRMKPARSAPASAAAATSSSRVSPHTLTSGRERSSRASLPVRRHASASNRRAPRRRPRARLLRPGHGSRCRSRRSTMRPAGSGRPARAASSDRSRRWRDHGR